MTTARRWRALATAAVTLITLSGCGWQGVNSLPLPGTAGGGPGAYTVQAQLPDVTNIEPNSRVRVGDVTVGNVTSVEQQGWHALVTMKLDGDVTLPANATAKVGQTSLLGTLHIELGPPTGEPSVGQLHSGSIIPLARAGAFPTTEQTLASLSLLLNGGGIGQIEDVTAAFSTAFHGREQRLRDLTGRLDSFVGQLDGQKDDILTAIESFNRLITQFAEQQPVVDTALRTIPDALTVLRDQRQHLTETFHQFAQLNALTTDAVERTKENLVKEMKDLGPVLNSLANAGPALTRSMSMLTTYPWPKENLANWMRGDYANISLVLDMTLSRMDATIFTGTRFEGDLTKLEMQWGRTIGQMPSPYTADNPLLAPYRFDQGP